MTPTFSVFLPNQENFPTASSPKLHLCVHQKDWGTNRKELSLTLCDKSLTLVGHSSSVFAETSPKGSSRLLWARHVTDHTCSPSLFPITQGSGHPYIPKFLPREPSYFFDAKSTYILLQYTVSLIKLYRHNCKMSHDTSAYDCLFFVFVFLPFFGGNEADHYTDQKAISGLFKNMTWHQLCIYKWSPFWTFPKSTWCSVDWLGLLWNSDEGREKAPTLCPSLDPCLRSGCTSSGSCIISI